uniref:Aquaporin n=1 Tax=Cacopsylla melanoneura TaxID=428564 RepID=A0A8D8UXS0_9HEMI
MADNSLYFNIFVSGFYILLTGMVCYWLRQVIGRFFRYKTFTKDLLLEMVATAELCASCYELIVVADNWGVYAYGVTLFFLTIWWSLNWGDASACPYTHLEDVAERKSNLLIALFKIGAELLGGYAIIKYVQLLWSLEIASVHLGQSKTVYKCQADLQVPVLAGMLVEGLATFLCRFMTRIFAEKVPKLGMFLDATFGTLLVVAAFNYSGGYFNPALAGSLKYGCTGHTITEHLLVYWLSPTIGSLLSVYAFSRLQAGKIKRD